MILQCNITVTTREYCNNMAICTGIQANYIGVRCVYHEQ
jgi:hypothetical protein